MSKNDYVLLHDKVAKKIFKSDDIGLDYTARIVSEVLKEDYEEIRKNLKPISDEISISSLLINSEADVVYENDTIIIDLEINYDYGPNRKAQEFSYISQLFLGQIKNKDKYTDLKKVVQIVIENYDFFKKGQFVYQVVLKENNLNLIEDANFVKYHISLDYLKNLDYNKVTEGLQKLLYFLINENKKELDVVYKGDDFMEEVIKKAKQIAGEEKIPLYLKDDEIRKLDQEYHFNQGAEQTRKEMIVNFYKNGVSLDLICKSSNLSLEEVQKIIYENKD